MILLRKGSKSMDFEVPAGLAGSILERGSKNAGQVCKAD